MDDVGKPNIKKQHKHLWRTQNISRMFHFSQQYVLLYTGKKVSHFIIGSAPFPAIYYCRARDLGCQAGITFTWYELSSLMDSCCKKWAVKSLPSKTEEQIQAFHREKRGCHTSTLQTWIQRLVMLVYLKGMSEWTWTKCTLAACTFVCMPLFVQLGKVTMQSNIHCNTVSPSPPRKIIVYTSYVYQYKRK